MAKKINKKQTIKNKSLVKMNIYVIVINYSYTEKVIKLLQECGSNVQFVNFAKGTSKTGGWNMFGLENDRKDVIMAFVDSKNTKEIKELLNIYFEKNKSSTGFAFTVPITSIVGVKMYEFLTNSL